MAGLVAIVAWFMMVHHHDGERRALPPRPLSMINPVPEIEED